MRNTDFVHWFRHASPYIHAHRHKTFVIFFGGEAVLESDFEQHVRDFALLHSLGVRLVLVHGIRPQIDARLCHYQTEAKFYQGLRITDAIALQCVKEAAGLVRMDIEALLSFGVSASPLANAKIDIATLNCLVAKPIGVVDGIDYCYTGEVRRVDSGALQALLKQNQLVLVSPIGYSPTGEVFNLAAEQVATEIALALKAEKLILLTEQPCQLANGEPIAQMTTAEARLFLQQTPNLPVSVQLSLNAAVQSCEAGVARVHLIDRRINGALLLELFSRDGVGTLVSLTPFENLRPASLNDIAGMIELIKPLERQGILASRSRERLERELADYLVIERDGLIIGCSALHVQERYGVCACVAVHGNYRGAERGNRLLNAIESKAKELALESLFVLSTKTMHWFIERGFVATTINSLPDSLKALYNPQRNSKILCKKME